MNPLTFGAEAGVYTSSTHGTASSWTNGADIQVGLSQLGGLTPLRPPIICDRSCPPPYCHHFCGPCVTNPAEPTGCARTCTTCCPDTGCDTWYSDCPAESCCTEALVWARALGKPVKVPFRIVPEHPARERNPAQLAAKPSLGLANEIILSV